MAIVRVFFKNSQKGGRWFINFLQTGVSFTLSVDLLITELGRDCRYLILHI